MKAYEHCNTVARDETESRAIDDELARTGVDELPELGDELLGVRGIDPTIRRKNHNVSVGAVIVELHR